MSSNELFVGTKKGNVVTTRSCVRLVERSRWSRATVEALLGTPGDRNPVEADELDPDEIEAAENPHDFDQADA